MGRPHRTRGAATRLAGEGWGLVKLGKDWRLLVRHAQKAGWTLERGGKHPKLRSPTGQVIPLPSTPAAGKRGLANKRAELRRAGVAC